MNHDAITVMPDTVSKTPAFPTVRGFDAGGRDFALGATGASGRRGKMPRAGGSEVLSAALRSFERATNTMGCHSEIDEPARHDPRPLAVASHSETVPMRCEPERKCLQAARHVLEHATAPMSPGRKEI
ncbi:Uncharacterized protein pbN1_01190 [Aromatoleum bremense]|nr:Uncharacterized protein pbN1_01190 [Aromatoleum bremense]